MPDGAGTADVGCPLEEYFRLFGRLEAFLRLENAAFIDRPVVQTHFFTAVCGYQKRMSPPFVRSNGYTRQRRGLPTIGRNNALKLPFRRL